MKNLLVIVLLLLIGACGSKKNSSSQEIEIDSIAAVHHAAIDTVNYTALGFTLMYTEQFEWLKLRVTSEYVINFIGEPDSKSIISFDDKDEVSRQTWFYMAKGFEMLLYKEGEVWLVENYALKQKPTLKSTRGVGIGSSREEVRQAYSEEIRSNDHPNQILAGSLFAGIVFSLSEGKVSSIFVGTSVKRNSNNEIESVL